MGAFDVTGEWASAQSLQGTAAGERVFQEVEKMLIQYNLKWTLLRCVTTVLVNVCGG